MSLRLLRGRVMIRPEKDKPSLIIATPEPGRTNRNTLGIGTVIAVGPPALTPLRWDADAGVWRGGVEIPHAFSVGDRVRFVGQHVSRRGEWDGEEVSFCSVEEVQCVIDP